MASATVSLDHLEVIVSQLGADVDYTPAMKSCRQIVISAAKFNFDDQKAPDGIPWAPLKRQRGKRKGRGKSRGHDKILRDTGLLMQSLTAASGGARTIDILTSTSMEWGTNVDYAQYLQEGTGDFRGKRNYGGSGKGMVARPFLGLNDTIEEEIEEAVAGFVEREILKRIG